MLARPELERLAAKVGEAAGLSIAEGPLVRYIAQVSTPHEVQVRDWTGTTAPMHAVSSGHVFLAAMSTDEVRALLPTRLEALTPRTITRRSDLERRLVAVRRAGYAWVRDEFAEGITSVAALVVDRDGAVGRGGPHPRAHVPVPASGIGCPDRRRPVGLRQTGLDSDGKSADRPLTAGPRTGVVAYIRPTTWPSGSAKSAIVVSGATSVSGMITRPPFASTAARTPLGSSACT